MPASDFASHDPDFGPDQEEQCARIVAGVRALNSRIMRLGGSIEALTAAAERVEALVASLDDVTRTRAMESYRFRFDRDHPNAVIPFNPATGEFNPLAPAIQMSFDGEKLVAHCAFSNCYESGPDTVQGGMVAALYDQVLAYAVMGHGCTGPTLWLRVSYLAPTPIDERLRFEAEVDSIDGRKFSVKGRCLHGDRVVSEAEALMLSAYPVEVVGKAPAR